MSWEFDCLNAPGTLNGVTDIEERARIRHESMKAHIEMEHRTQAERKRDPGDAAAPASTSNGTLGAAQLSDHGLLRELEALGVKFSSESMEGVVLRMVRRRFEALLNIDVRRAHEMEKAHASERRAQDRLRLIRLVLTTD